MNILIPTFEDTMKYGRVRFGRVHSHDHAHAECSLEGQSSVHSRGLLGVRGAMMASKSGWANPYVTDGLVAMWDGEWNAGGGKHDASATTWADLSGNGNNATVQAGVFSEKSLQALLVDGTITPHVATIANSSFFFSPVVASGELTTEICSNNMSLADTFDRFHFVFSDGNGQCLLYLPSGFGYSGYNWGAKGYGYWFSEVGCGLANGMTASWRSSSDERVVYRNGVRYLTSSGASMSTVYKNPVYLKGAGDTYSIRFYSRALTDAEVAANYAIDKARFNLT